MDVIGNWMEKNIKEILESYRVVSFDIFDTLLYRTVPECSMIFDIVEEIYNNGASKRIKSFKKKRVKAEKDARRNSRSEDVTLECIYNFIKSPLEVKDELKRIEEEVEIQNIVGNRPMVELTDWCLAEGKIVVITTDMYLPRTVLHKMLEKIGVKYHRMFISGEEGVAKYSGNLYNVVLQELNIRPTDIIHIGDNPVNDILRAREKDIMALERIEEDCKYALYNISSRDVKWLCTQELIRRTIPKDGKKTLPRIGYGILGPFLVDFCKWIHSIKKQQELDNLYFVAREGFLIKEVYDILYPEEKCSTYYIRINKNLLRLPLTIGENRIRNFFTALPARNEFTWSEILHSVCHDESRNNNCLTEIRERYGIDIGKTVRRDSILNGHFDAILNYVFDYYQDVIQSQKEYLMEYLSDIGLTGTSVGLINNSVNGSGQSLLEEYLKDQNVQTRIYGIQLIDSPQCRKKLCGRYSTYFGDGGFPDFMKFNLGRNSIVYEHLLFEPSGTALYFQRLNNKVEAVCESQRLEKKNNQLMKELQEYACIYANVAKSNIDMGVTFAGAILLYKLIMTPYADDAYLICNLYDDDNTGDGKLVEFDNCGKLHNLLFLPAKMKDCKWVEGVYSYKNVNRFTFMAFVVKQYLRYIKSILRDV